MQDNPLVTTGLPIALMIIMTGMGLSLGVKDFRRIVEQPRGVAVGTFVQLLLIPLLGFALGWLFGGGVLAVGIVLVAVLPGGTTSNLLCFLGRANLALSITLTVTASLITSVTVPLYLNVALEMFVGDGEQIVLPFAKTLRTMAMIVVIPVFVGMIVNAVVPKFAKKMEPIIGLFSLLVLLFIIVLIIWTERDNLPTIIAQVWQPVLSLNLLSIAIGLLSGKLTGLSAKDSITVAIEASIKNTTLGLAIALSILKNNELALPAAAFGLLMYASVAMLTMYGRHLDRRENAVVASEPVVE